MSGPAVIFREAHRLRKFAHELQEQINRYPLQLKAQQAKVARQEEAQRNGQETLKKLKMALHEKDVTLKATHTQIAKFTKQLDEAGSKKEYDGKQLEIANARAKIQQLEDEILAGITESEERTAQLPELERAVQQARQDFAAWEKGAQERIAQQKKQLAEATARIKEVEASLPDKYREMYRRIVNAKGHDAFSAVVDGTCTACSTTITVQQVNDLRAEGCLACRACERLLYMAE